MDIVQQNSYTSILSVQVCLPSVPVLGNDATLLRSMDKILSISCRGVDPRRRNFLLLLSDWVVLVYNVRAGLQIVELSLLPFEFCSSLLQFFPISCWSCGLQLPQQSSTCLLCLSAAKGQMLWSFLIFSKELVAQGVSCLEKLSCYSDFRGEFIMNCQPHY